MPADTNPHGDIFGGWVVSQMDLAAGVLAKKISKGRAVTVAINSMSFIKPVHVGDLLSCYVQLLKTGHSSLTIGVEAWSRDFIENSFYQVTKGLFVFVAIDDEGKPRPVPKHGS